MPNVIIALNLIGTLLQQAMGIGSAIATAQQAGTDITPDQLTTLAGAYQTALAQLNIDIAASAAKGE